MKKKIIGILDREEAYTRRLMEAFNSKNRMGFQAEMFTGTEALLEYSRKNPLEILLIGEALMDKTLEHIEAMVVVISEGTSGAKSENYQIVYKYQSSELIIRKVLEYYAKEAGESSKQLCGTNVKMYGIYAPNDRTCKSGFAWNLAKRIGREKSVLYISLTAFCDKKELYITDKELADIMYYVRHGFENLIYRIGSVTVAYDGIDCMPLMKSVEDLLHVTVEDWLKILRIIRTQSNYGVVVIEVEECVQQFYRILDYCTEIYMPFIQQRRQVVKWELCEEYFKQVGAEDVWNRVKQLEVNANYWRNDMNSIIQF